MNRLENLMNDNSFTEISHGITNKLQQIMRKCINKYKNIIKPNDKSKYINMNPKAAHIYGTIKLHKQGKPIRQIVNWIHSPSYKLAKHLNTILTKLLQLPKAVNVQNTSTLTHSLKLIKISKDIQIQVFSLHTYVHY